MGKDVAFFDCIVLFFLAVTVHLFAEVTDMGVLLWMALGLYAGTVWKGLIAWEMYDYGKVQGSSSEGREGPEV